MASPPSPPPVPDPYKTSSAQQVASVEVAYANTALSNANETRPDGTVRFEQLPEEQGIVTYTFDASGDAITSRVVKRWHKIVELSPKGQQAFDSREDISVLTNQVSLAKLQILKDRFEEPLDISTLPARPSIPAPPVVNKQSPLARSFIRDIGDDDLRAHLALVENDIRYRLDADSSLDRQRRTADLADRGLFPGADAYARSMIEFDRKDTDARIQARLAAKQEQTRLIQVEAMVGDFHNKVVREEWTMAVMVIDTRNRLEMQTFQAATSVSEFVSAMRREALQELIAVRGFDSNEMSTLIHGGQIQIPQFQPFRAGQIEQPKLMEAVYRSAAIEQQNYQTQVQSHNQMMGGIFGLMGNLIGAPFMASDPRLKTDIQPPASMLEKIKDLDVLEWRYSDEAQAVHGLDGDVHVGPMADQWAALFGGDGERISTVEATQCLMTACREAGISPVDLFGTAILLLQKGGWCNE